MSKLDKAIQRLKSKPKDYTYSEAKQLLGQLGFQEFILEYVRSFRRKVLRTLYIQRLICSKQEYFFFREYSKGKTSGSRVKFFRPNDNSIILLHKPHPGDIMPQAAARDLHDTLKNKGDI